MSQSQKFTRPGVRIPITRIQAGPVFVVQIKNNDKDGYMALQLGWGEKTKNIKKPNLGHFKKAGIKKNPRFLREIKVEEVDSFKVGDQIKLANVLKPGDLVNVTGISKGKGFAGVVKRHGFAGGPKTHGQSDRERAPGSIGSTTTPGRVLKGKRMAGHMGVEKRTVRNLVVTNVDSENDLLVIKGLVPGNIGGLLVINKVGEDKKFVPDETEEKQEEEVKVKEEAVGTEEQEAAGEDQNKDHKENKDVKQDAEVAETERVEEQKDEKENKEEPSSAKASTFADASVDKLEGKAE